MESPSRNLLIILGGMIVAYCVVTLAVVTTSADLRVRCLLVDNDHPETLGQGVVLREVSDAKTQGARLEAGDVLVQLGDSKIEHFVDFTQAVAGLSWADIPPGGKIIVGEDPLRPNLPSLVQDKDGNRWVRARVRKEGSGSEAWTAIQLQAVPLREAGLTLLWFALQLVIFAVGALAIWHRPFDRPARLFFAMCIVTLAAFVGGFHWWVTSANFGLQLPFVVCALLVPVVTFHFFLVFPRPKAVLTRSPVGVLAGIYALPVIGIVLFTIMTGSIWWLLGQTENDLRTIQIVQWLLWLRAGVYMALGVAAVYFAATLAALAHSVHANRHPLEQLQVRSILGAAGAATIFIGYTLVLAYYRREEFALGGGRLPMFFASLFFMVAYAVAIVRFKLMLIEQIVSRGVWYYALSYGATGVVAGMIACGALVASYGIRNITGLQTGLVALILTLAVILLIWLRDSWQRLVDREYFREKYRLDKAMQRINRAVNHLADARSLSERMLASCRDVLISERAALYLREGKSNTFQLTAAEGIVAGIPATFTMPDETLQELITDGLLQRVPTGPATDLSPVQQTLRATYAQALLGLELDGEVVGLVALGPKHAGGAYTAEDATFLTALGQITSVALHCAKVHQDMTHLNQELQMKAERMAQQKQQITILQAELTASHKVSPASEVPDFQRDAIIGRSVALERVMETVRKVASSDTTVLIRGESGTGKERLAHVVHANSSRANGPLVCVHCGALSPTLLESELFGHVKGAFTGAHADKRGRFEMADGGSLFLDEIGDISAETQIKLLRVLQERSFEPVGSGEPRSVNVRLIAATHQNLERLIAEGKFREDLYYRLNVISVTLPPLRERREDVLELAVHFLARAAAKAGKRIVGFDEEALDALGRYDWPGNIRELENIIERATVLAEGPAIQLVDLPPDVQLAARTALGGGLSDSHTARSRRQDFYTGVRSMPAIVDVDRVATRRRSATALTGLPESLAEADERARLMLALDRCQGNKAQAARLLQMPRSTFFSKLRKYGIDR